MAMQEVEGRINTAVANGVWWGTRSTLVTSLSHFLELKSELELLGSIKNADVSGDQVMPHDPW
jgi:hypothetical protein